MVGSGPWATTTRTRLFLSLIVGLSDPEPWIVHPSGYFIENPALWSTRNTWLSGMSPVAADCASAESAPGAPAVALVVVEAFADVAAGAVAPVGAAAVVVDEEEEPHPAATAEKTSAKAM